MARRTRGQTKKYSLPDQVKVNTPEKERKFKQKKFREKTEALGGKVKKGHVVVIRYEGPKGGPGMREMLGPTSAIMGKGLGEDVALITDGRFSGGSHGFVIGHVSPEAAMKGPIAIIKNGDQIVIDAQLQKIDLKISKAEIKKRTAKLSDFKKRYKKGILAKYASLVSSASKGAVTDMFN